MPFDLPEGRDELPGLVIERGYMDFIDRMRVEAAWWLIASKGDIRAAIVLAINREKWEIIVEEWRTVVSDDKDDMLLNGKPIPTRTQKVTITQSDNGEKCVAGAPFTIQFYDLYLREPANEKEKDFVYTTADLEEFARLVWRRQLRTGK